MSASSTSLYSAANGTDKATSALSLFQALRATMAADQLPAPAATVAAAAASPSSPVSDSMEHAAAAAAAAPSSKRPPAKARSAHKVVAPEEEGADPEKELLRRQLTHAKELARKLYHRNSLLRTRVRQLEADAVTLHREREEREAQDSGQARIAELTAQVAALTEALAQTQAARRDEAAAAKEEERCEGGAPSLPLSLRITALESELAALTHRLSLCEAQRDRLADVQLAPLLLPEQPSPSTSAKGSAQEARAARLVNTEVRKLFTALRQQLVEEASLREAERARRSEVLYLLEREWVAPH